MTWNSVMEVSGDPGKMPPSTTSSRNNERPRRTRDYREVSFVEAIVGRRGTLRGVFAQLEAVAPTNTTVLIGGETGTGKEVIARAIHELSPRRSHNMVKVNCAAMPLGLLETELFGHERGAFTGAITSRPGRFALADRGTLFLDEIGDIPLELQPKLLRVLQEREFEPVGSTRTTRADVRVVVASNCDLRQMVRDRRFREDLYYRLNAFPIFLPPLRERKADVPTLVWHFVQQFAMSTGKIIETIPDETMQMIVRHTWPGNIRELQNYVARGVILSRDGVFDPTPPDRYAPEPLEAINGTLQDTLRREIVAACRYTNWKLGGPQGAAARLGLKRTTLFYKMKRLGITPAADGVRLPLRTNADSESFE